MVVVVGSEAKSVSRAGVSHAACEWVTGEAIVESLRCSWRVIGCPWSGCATIQLPRWCHAGRSCARADWNGVSGEIRLADQPGIADVDDHPDHLDEGLCDDGGLQPALYPVGRARASGSTTRELRVAPEKATARGEAGTSRRNSPATACRRVA